MAGTSRGGPDPRRRIAATDDDRGALDGRAIGPDRQEADDVRRGGWKTASAEGSAQAATPAGEPNQAPGPGDAGGVSRVAHWADRGVTADAGITGRPDLPEQDGPVHPPCRSPRRTGDPPSSPVRAPATSRKPSRAQPVGLASKAWEQPARASLGASSTVARTTRVAPTRRGCLRPPIMVTITRKSWASGRKGCGAERPRDPDQMRIATGSIASSQRRIRMPATGNQARFRSSQAAGAAEGSRGRLTASSPTTARPNPAGALGTGPG